VLDRHREQVLKESTADTDDVLGVDEKDEQWEEQLSTKRSPKLRIVSRKKR
jgi:hypothetical protein